MSSATFKEWEVQFLWAQRCRQFNRQQKCAHLKGGRLASRIFRKDYAVGFHTFIDGSQKIWCLLGCGFEVFNKPEWSFKWAVGFKMVEQSTNFPSSSETIVSKPPEPCQSLASKEKEFRPYTHDTESIDIGEASPIKGRQEATKWRDEDDNHDFVIV